eukprot:g29637.t1
MRLVLQKCQATTAMRQSLVTKMSWMSQLRMNRRAPPPRIGGKTLSPATPLALNTMGDRIENEYFRGQMLMMHRTTEQNTAPTTPYAQYFAKKTRRWELRLQGQFRRSPGGKLYMGVVLRDFDYSQPLSTFIHWLSTLSLTPLDSLCDLRKADLALRKAQLLKLRDGEVDLELLFPPDDPEAASECSQTFASDAYGLRRWARQDSQDAGAAEEGLEGEGLGGLGQPAVVDVGANVGCWSIFAAKVMKAQVVAVEPSRHAAFYLACNVRLNRIEPQVTLMNAAMVPRDCTGQMQVFCNPGTSDVQGGSVLDMLHQSCNDDEDHDVVEGVDLESLLEKTRSSTHRLYLRMNCEGCEGREPAMAPFVYQSVPPHEGEVRTSTEEVWLLRRPCTALAPAAVVAAAAFLCIFLAGSPISSTDSVVEEEMQKHEGIEFAGAAWAATISVMNKADRIRSAWGSLWEGRVNRSFRGPTVDDMHVADRRMHAVLRTGLVEGQTNVCPAIDDWDIDMLNEDRERLGKLTRVRGNEWRVSRMMVGIEKLPNGNVTFVHEGFLNALNHVLPHVKRWVDGYILGSSAYLEA